jgi:hypothetical protein
MARCWSLVPLSLGVALLAAPVHAEVVRLAGGWNIESSIDAKTGVATIALTQSGRFNQSLSFGNALEPEAPQAFTPCVGCTQAYLIAVDDASSTYAARHGIIVWPGGPAPWWSLTPLPFDQFELIGASSGGVGLIKDLASQIRYRFDDGLLVLDR